MKEICPQFKCTGCFACINSCPNDAIIMKELGELRDIYPTINQDKCINCIKCQKSCPEINNISKSKSMECYAAYVKDENIYKRSSSGGLAYLISSHIIKNNGVLYTCLFNKKSLLEFTRISKYEMIKQTQGSKYTHSHIGFSLKQIENDLINDTKVLFIGSPCQCAALYSFLQKQYNNLTTIDFVCHGMPSQYLLKKQIEELTDNNNNFKVQFRTQEKHYPFTFTILKKNKTITRKWYKNPYFYSFMQGVSYRESCYNCKYSNIERVSDITLGDFWGLNSESEISKSADSGVSLVLINTKHGKNIFTDISHKIYYEKRPLSEAIKGNEQLKTSSKKTPKRNKFITTFAKTNSITKAYRTTFILHYIKNLFIK